MVRLGAVLCGSVMYGLVRLARLGRVLQGAAWNGLAGTVGTGYARRCMERFGRMGVERRVIVRP